MKLPIRTLAVLALLVPAPPLPAQQAESTPPPEQGRLQDEAPVWAGSFDEALERARTLRDGRVLVEVRPAACADCERMEKLVYPSASFRAFCRDKVPVSLLAGSAEAETVIRRFGVRKLPAWLVVTPDLLLSGKQEGESNQSTWVERFVATEREWALFLRKLEEERKSPGDHAAVIAVAEEAFRRYGDEMAEKRFRSVADDRKAPAPLREKSYSYLASIELSANRLDDAERDLEALLALTKDPGLREKAELRLVDVQVGRGERRKAEEMLEAFLAKHPQSPLAAEAKAILEALRTPRS